MTEISHADIARKVEDLSDTVDKLESTVGKMADDAAKTRELVEAYTAFKTGGRFVAWFAKFMAGLLAIWVFVKGGAQLLVELGKPPV